MSGWVHGGAVVFWERYWPDGLVMMVVLGYLLVGGLGGVFTKAVAAGNVINYFLGNGHRSSR